MRNLLSTAIIAFALALLVPSNGAEAVRLVSLGADVLQPVRATMGLDLPAERPSTEATLAGPGAPDSGLAWLMALGFLGAVIARRMRG